MIIEYSDNCWINEESKSSSIVITSRSNTCFVYYVLNFIFLPMIALLCADLPKDDDHGLIPAKWVISSLMLLQYNDNNNTNNTDEAVSSHNHRSLFSVPTGTLIR